MLTSGYLLRLFGALWSKGSPVSLVFKKLKGSWAIGWGISTPEAGKVQGDGEHSSIQGAKYFTFYPFQDSYHDLRPNKLTIKTITPLWVLRRQKEEDQIE